MDKADIALVVAGLSAFASIASAIFAGRMARNDSERMRRTGPTLEVQVGSSQSEFEGWEGTLATVRNHEPVGVIVTGIRATKWSARVNSYDDAAAGEYDPSIGRRPLKTTLDDKRRTTIRRTVGPRGSKANPGNLAPSEAAHINLYTKGVEKSTDLALDWEWADGQKK